MYHPTDFDDLRSIGLSERDALAAAAMLPHLPDTDALARVIPDDERGAPFPRDDRVDDFADRVPTVGGASNLRRVTVDHDAAPDDKVSIEPTPHGLRSYHVTPVDVDLLGPTDDEYDFEDTDQSLLSDFGFESSILTAVGATIRPYQFPRKPRFPTYTG